MTEVEIEEYFLSRSLHPEAEEYIRTHSKRFAYLLKLVKKHRSLLPASSIEILDVGPSFFTHLLQTTFPEDRIHTLGFTHPESRGGHLPDFIDIPQDTFTQFDLNDSQYEERWVSTGPFDLVIMGEVLEHLYTSPVKVLSFLRSITRAEGRCIIGTPNAVTLIRRLHVMFGRNPYENIREDRENPGHFREYTVKELIAMGEKAGWQVDEVELKNYFKAFSVKGKLFDQAVRYLLPASFNTGINIVYQAPRSN